jgi:hypothetical protein
MTAIFSLSVNKSLTVVPNRHYSMSISMCKFGLMCSGRSTQLYTISLSVFAFCQTKVAHMPGEVVFSIFKPVAILNFLGFSKRDLQALSHT